MITVRAVYQLDLSPISSSHFFGLRLILALALACFNNLAMVICFKLIAAEQLVALIRSERIGSGYGFKQIMRKSVNADNNSDSPSF